MYAIAIISLKLYKLKNLKINNKNIVYSIEVKGNKNVQFITGI